MKIKPFLFVLLSFFISQAILAASIDWSVATTSFPHDQSLGDTGHEKTPFGYVDLPTGNIVFDVPEVTLKGHRGLDFTLSRSYGKVNNGFRSMANWELEVPRLVMMTGPSTKLKGDVDGTGICNNNGDYSNGTSGGAPSYITTIVNDKYRNEVKSSYLSLANANYLKGLANALKNASQEKSAATSTPQYTNNKTNAQYIYNGIPYVNSSGSADVASNFNSFIENLNTSNNQSVVDTHLNTSLYTFNYYINDKNIHKVIIKFSNGTSKTLSNNGSKLDGNVLIANFNYEVLNDSNVKVLFYNDVGKEVILANGGVDIMPLIYTTAYANTLKSIIDTSWQYTPFNNTISVDFQLSSNVDTRKRPITLYLPAQANITFYPIKGEASKLGYPSNAKYISQDNSYISCSSNGTDFEVRVSNGQKYTFTSSNRENQTGYPTLFSGQFVSGRVTIYADTISNQFGESYKLNYFSKVNTNVAYKDYSSSKKLFLLSVSHLLDGKQITTSDEIRLNYVKQKGTAIETTLANFNSYSGDIVLKNIQRLVNGAYVTWSAFNYSSGQKASGNYAITDQPSYSTSTIGEIQDRQAATLYLSSVGNINGNAVSYQYGGPYRIFGNHAPNDSVASITTQGYIWFYSDLTKATFSKTKADKTTLEQALSTSWTYSKVDVPRAGFSEASSFRVAQSDSLIANNGQNQSHKVAYDYRARNATDNSQTTNVTETDGAYGGTKTFSYTYYSFKNGVADSALHGLLWLKRLSKRTETYAWDTSVVFGSTPNTDTGNYDGYRDVSYMRLKSKTVNHYGNYTTNYSNFDTYANAQTITTTGLNQGRQITHTTTLQFFNADYNNADVRDGIYPWLVGLTKAQNAGSYALASTSYDNYGAITSNTSAGAKTTYKYETKSFFSCLGELVSFKWTSFVSCLGDYSAGAHSGLVIEKNVGNGQLITQYAHYKYGVPQRVKNPNDGEETNEVNDFGGITKHTDADGIKSITTYDNSGRVVSEEPLSGLAITNYTYDGLTIKKDTGNGAIVSKETVNGNGKTVLIHTQSGGKNIYIYQDYDTFGNLRKSSDPLTSASTSPTYTISKEYDEFGRIVSNTDHNNLTTYCYQKCSDQYGTVFEGAYSIVENNGNIVKQWYYALGDFNTNLVSNSVQIGSDGIPIEAKITYDSDLLQPTKNILGSLTGGSKQEYVYDSNGLLTSETDKASGAKTYTYDSAGRTSTITYADGNKESFSYDSKVGSQPSKRTIGNNSISYTYSPAGRLLTSDGGGAKLTYSLDSYGRISTLTQNITGNNAKTYTINYAYNNLSQLTSIAYPNGKVVDLSKQNGFGEISSIPNVLQAISYNEYHQPTIIQANDDVVWTLSYDTAGKSKALKYDALGNCQLDLSYEYDTLNRLTKIKDICGGKYTAIIERYGNGQLKKAEMAQGTYEYTYDNDSYDIKTVKAAIKQGSNIVETINTYKYLSTKSQLEQIYNSPYKFTYDAVGRVTSDNVRSMTYDVFGRMQTAGGDSYIYAPNNLRVRATRSNSTVDYVYGLNGELLVEVDLTTGLVRNYVYLAGQQVATLERFSGIDSDGDGLSDVEEQELGLNPNYAGDAYNDTDDDGLPDYLERYLGLNPNKEDSDGDGFRDGYEYKTLGLRVALDKNMYPSTPEPEEDLSWLPAVMSLLLDDEEA